MRDLAVQWDHMLLAAAENYGEDLQWPISETGTVLRPGADHPAVVALEQRLGTRLPPSYRSFLLTSDGAWAQPGWGMCGIDAAPDDEADPTWAFGLLDMRQVTWLRDSSPGSVETCGSPHRGADSPSSHPAFTLEYASELDYLDHEEHAEEMKPGHFLYLLQISRNIDGYVILLNPLVVDADGEWEAWDFGVKSAGVTRYRSFADLLAADTEDFRQQAGMDTTPRQSVADIEAVARDESLPVPDRVRAVHLIEHQGGSERVRDLLLEWATAPPSGFIAFRQAALIVLGRHGGSDAVRLLIEAATDPEPRIRAAAIPGLAAADEPDARRAAVTLLSNPGEEGFVIQSVDGRGRDALLEAWNLGRQPRVLAWLAYFGDPRAVPGLVEAMPDPALPASDRAALVRYAARPGNRAVIPALNAAAELPGASLEGVAEALGMLGAADDRTETLCQLLLHVEENGPEGAGYLGHALTEAGSLNDPRTTDALVRLCRKHPSTDAIRALGWTSGSATIEVLSRAAANPTLHLAAVDALERVRDAAASDVLADKAAAGDILSLRALARRRDARALTPLLGLLKGGDPELALQGADGLRDLRHPAAAGPLLAALVPDADPDLQAVTAHALVSMRAPEMNEAVERLAHSDSESLRGLAERWRSVSVDTA